MFAISKGSGKREIKMSKKYNKDSKSPHIFKDQLDPQSNIFTRHLELGARPRQYAAKIIDKKTILERRELLSQVPEEYRALVETHVRIAFDRLANQK